MLNLDVSIDQAQSIFETIPLSNFYMIFGVAEGSNEEEELNKVLCQVIQKLLEPFTYDMINSDESNMVYKMNSIYYFFIKHSKPHPPMPMHRV